MFAALVAACFMTVAAFAADASPTGTWKYTQPGRGGGPGVERTLMLDLKDGNLTGTLKGASMGQFEIPDAAISEGTFKDGVVAFSVTTERNGQKRTAKYQGKLEGDTIKGTVEQPGRGGGAPQSTEWVATRAK